MSIVNSLTADVSRHLAVVVAHRTGKIMKIFLIFEKEKIFYKMIFYDKPIVRNRDGRKVKVYTHVTFLEKEFELKGQTQIIIIPNKIN
jgi:hypothetical protein